MHDILASPDVCLTNAKDKELMLPVVTQTNARVQKVFSPETIEESSAQAGHIV